MVVNCLPLLEMRSGQVATSTKERAASVSGGSSAAAAAQHVHSATETGHTAGGTKISKRFVLKKASSSEDVLAHETPRPEPSKRSSEAEDILDQGGKDSIQVQREKWAHFSSSYSANYSTRVRDSQVTAELPTQTKPEGAPELNMEKEEGGGGGGDGGGGGGGGGGGATGEASKQGGGGENGTVAPADVGERKMDVNKGKFGIMSDGGSEEEEGQELKVSYIENPEEIITLKRSSGSVSFIGSLTRGGQLSQPPPASVMEDGGEGEEGAVGGKEEGGGEVEGEKEKVGGGSGEEGEVEGGGSEGGRVQGEAAVVEEGKKEGGERKTDEAKEKDEGERERNQSSAKDETRKQEDTSEESVPVAAAAEPVPQKPPPLPATSLQSPPPLLSPPPPSQPPQQDGPAASPRPSGPVVTPLPPPPPTFEPEFIERSGWLTKLSHKKGN